MEDTVAAVRGFNRYYTNVIGALGEGHLDSPYTLTEARVLYELAQQATRETVELRRGLAIDAGYLTRILTRFERDGLITRQRSTVDTRRQVVALTKLGQATFSTLNRRASRDVARLLAPLSAGERDQLRRAMTTVQALLDGADPPADGSVGDSDGSVGDSDGSVGSRIQLRGPVPGDLGWIVQRHGELYAAEYGWDASFEALVAGIVAGYAAGHDAAHERTWIAEVDGERVGCVMCVRADGSAGSAGSAFDAKLRLLLVEPGARGHGVGQRLVGECVAFARGAGYRRMVLWTQSILTAARRIYATYGFELVDSAPHHSFGADLVEETWALDLVASG